MGGVQASAHSTSVLSSIHEKDKGGALNAGEEKLMDKRHHRKDGDSNGNND